MTRPIVLWLKRDLRTADHAALAQAMAMGPVLPLYVWEPDLWAQDDASHRQWAFVREVWPNCAWPWMRWACIWWNAWERPQAFWLMFINKFRLIT